MEELRNEIKKTIPVIGCIECYELNGDNYKIGINLLNSNFAKDKEKLWYFVITCFSSIFAYNSNLDGIMFKTKEECLTFSKELAKNLKKENFLEEKDNVHKSRV